MARGTLAELMGGYNQSLEVMQKNMFKLGTTFDDFKKKTEKVTKVVKEQVRAENELDIRFERRTRALTDATAALNKQGKAFEIFSKASREAFKEAGGNIFEFFDVALSSASEQVKIFGLEAANARKIMYGFLPPGMFRLVNKLSTGFRTLGSVTRNLKMGAPEEGEANNIFTTIGRAAKRVSPSKIFGTGGRDVSKARARISELESLPDYLMHGTDAQGNKVDSAKKKELAGLRSFVAKNTTAFTKTKDALAGVPLRVEKARAFLELMFLKAKVKTLRLEKKFLDAASNFYVMSMKERGKTIADQFIKLIKTPVMQFLVTGLMYLTGIALVIVLIRKTIWPAIKSAFDTFKENLGLVLAGFGNIFEGVKTVFTGLINGDLMMMIEGILDIALGVLQVVIGVVYAGVLALFDFAIQVVMNFIVGIGEFFYKVFTDFDFFKKNIGKIALGVVAAIAFFVGLPAALTALGIIVIFTGLKWIWGKLKEVLPSGKKVKKFFGGVKDKLGFASGGLITGGMQLVGEKGPELVSLPAGSRVHSNSNSRGRAGGTVNNFNITINAKDTSKAEMRRMADEIGRMINSKINRSTSSSTFR
jgi:hypothetical protein|tara:strand:- start:1953 stop:3722 length:1770 start_codon:yes stop_codon:yes gene_type:complete